MTPNEIDQLIKDISSGDHQAFAALYAETRMAVYGVAFSIIKNHADTEDIVQDVYLNINKFASRYQPCGKGKAWILRITRNLAFTAIKKRKNQISLDEAPEMHDFRFENVDESILLQEALLTLKPKEREIVILYAVSGFSHREIVALLDIAYPTSRWHYYNAIKKLRKQLERGAIV